MRKLMVVLLVLAATAATSHARTWQVRKDGTGDFTTLQPVMEVAAAGDTVLIGAGRYTEYQMYDINGIFEANMYLRVLVPNLTLIGEGPDQTIIGPETYHDDYGTGPFGICFMRLPSVSSKVRNLAIENIDFGMYYEGYLDMSGCRVSGCDWGLHGWPDGSRIEDSEFSRNLFMGIGLYNDGIGPSRDAYISDCRFDNEMGSLYFGGVDGGYVTNCDFTGGRIGVMYFDGASGFVHDCRFENLENTSIELAFATCDLVNVVERDSGYGLYAEGSNISGTGNIFMDNPYRTFRLTYTQFHDFRGNHILNGGGYTVYCGAHIHEHLDIDFAGNYWGTDDPAQIAEWIWDIHDEPERTNATVIFEPFADQPVSTEARTWSDVKALYR